MKPLIIVALILLFLWVIFFVPFEGLGDAPKSDSFVGRVNEVGRVEHKGTLVEGRSRKLMKKKLPPPTLDELREVLLRLGKIEEDITDKELLS